MSFLLFQALNNFVLDDANNDDVMLKNVESEKMVVGALNTENGNNNFNFLISSKKYECYFDHWSRWEVYI